ncbi:UDP-N-acetylglucosamine 2-epimerase [Martelella mediterranea]|uniref:UDP-N-acetylglucosamine 2-epimerase (non-hydrolyzing) n=1 Tax=Martelella mediterranea TaxID=293089 RepID=A0A4R3NM83_9HYPH|nr:UDP-N-acetylglucosamine 2-epimerase [Martelella mediterranea]
MKVLSIFGTRPEAIKMAPVVRSMTNDSAIMSLTCVTGQHRSMLDQVLDLFEIRPDFDLSVMAPNQTLNSLSCKIIAGLDEVLDQVRPDYVLVHGDTTSAMAASLAAFHRGIKIGHVEAGLRT